MGTMIHLSLGRFQIDYGKNQFFENHSALFQKTDLGIVPDYGYEQPLMTEGYSRPLRHLVGRIELLGDTLASVRREHAENLDEYQTRYRRPVSFRKLCELISKINISGVTGQWTESPECYFLPPEVSKLLPNDEYPTGGKRPDFWAIELLLQGFTANAKLRLLALNPNNLDLPVIWPFGELVESGWAQREEFESELGADRRFLIVTEGSSDAHILQKALGLLRPHYADFFQFIDMKEGYPFSGTGNLFNFAKGLVSIGILNRVVILYDNDAEGVRSYNNTKALALPPNMITAKLPDLSSLKKFDTVGPHGQRRENINGKAASIECYLDLAYQSNQDKPRVRWSSYLESVDRYQGALESKTSFTKIFLRLQDRNPSYDFTNIEAVLDHLYKLCVQMVGA